MRRRPPIRSTSSPTCARRFPELQSQLPVGLDASIAYDATEFIRASIHEVEKTLARSRDRRHPGDLPVPRQSARDDHPDRHHSAVPRRRHDHSPGARLFDQSSDAARARARHRPRRRRRHRRRREHLPAYRGGHDAERRGAAGRARNHRPGHLDDDHARLRLCADRLRLRADRRAVSRIRLHPRRVGRRFRRHRADAVADDVRACC